MRKWAYLKQPFHTNKKDIVYKIMVHEQKKYTLVYLYCQRDADGSSYDYYYPDLESALEDWEGEIDEEGWHIAGNPLPGYSDDYIELAKGTD